MSQRGYLIKRVLQAIFSLWIIATILFFLFRMGLPDPTAALVTEGLNAEQRAAVRAQFGLEEPLWRQYVLFLTNAVQGAFGTSFSYRAPVSEIVWERLANTMILMLAAIVLAYAIGVPLGAWQSWRRGTHTDTVGIFFRLIFRSAPVFRTGMIAPMLPPSREHWFGTDHLGRDLLSQNVHGSQIALLVGFLGATLVVLIGTNVGLIAGDILGRHPA